MWEIFDFHHYKGLLPALYFKIKKLDLMDYKHLCNYCRWRHCSYHCLQILAARALLFMVEGPAVQLQLAQDQQLRILAAALDSTHDPVSGLV